MKTEELEKLGLTKEQISEVFKLNGADLTKKDARISELEGERDKYKGQLETAENTLSSFDGIDPTKIKEQIEDYKQAAENAKKDYERKIEQRDQRDWVNAKLDEYGVKSPFARRQLESDVMADDSGLKWKDGAFFGFDDFMKAAKEKDGSLYQTAEEKKAAEDAAALEGKAPRFTGPATGPTEGAGKKFVPPKIF